MKSTMTKRDVTEIAREESTGKRASSLEVDVVCKMTQGVEVDGGGGSVCCV